MSYIVFAVVVVVALAFLIVFNLVAAKRSHPARGSRPMPTGTEQAPEPPPPEEIPAALAEPPPAAMQEPPIEPIPQRAGVPLRPDDKEYRQALRNFTGETPDAEPASDVKPHTRDHEYRRALRSMEQQDK